MMIVDLSIIGILGAAISAMVLGAIWYSPFLFGNIWLREAGISKKAAKKHQLKTMVLAFILALIAAVIFALFLGDAPSFGSAVLIGFLSGLGWVGTSLGINYLFAQRSLKMFLIDAGYHILQFTLYGAILGLCHPMY